MLSHNLNSDYSSLQRAMPARTGTVEVYTVPITRTFLPHNAWTVVNPCLQSSWTFFYAVDQHRRGDDINIFNSTTAVSNSSFNVLSPATYCTHQQPTALTNTGNCDVHLGGTVFDLHLASSLSAGTNGHSGRAPKRMLAATGCRFLIIRVHP